jgi:hypothetical protein
LLLTGQPLRADARVTEAFDAGWRFLKAVARNEGKAGAWPSSGLCPDPEQ